MARGEQGGRWPDWCWHDGTPLDPALRGELTCPPPPLLEDFEFSEHGAELAKWSPLCSSAPLHLIPIGGRVSFYKVEELKPLAKRFTDPGSPGVIYRDVYDKLERALRCAPNTDARLCHDSLHHFLLPAFFHTLSALRDAGRSYSVVIRTFGTDGAKVVDAITAFSEGKHPTYAAVPELAQSQIALWQGKYLETGAAGGPPQYILQSNDGKVVVSDESLVEETLIKPQKRISAVCCRDDYESWKAHQYSPSAGKPLWVTEQDSLTHPIFFDDNIHNHPRDSIVAVRVRPTATSAYAALAPERALETHGVLTQRTPTFAAILDPSWFLRKIASCEQKKGLGAEASGVPGGAG